MAEWTKAVQAACKARAWGERGFKCGPKVDGMVNAGFEEERSLVVQIEPCCWSGWIWWKKASKKLLLRMFSMSGSSPLQGEP